MIDDLSGNFNDGWLRSSCGILERLSCVDFELQVFIILSKISKDLIFFLANLRVFGLWKAENEPKTLAS